MCEDENLDGAGSWKRCVELLDLAGLEHRDSAPPDRSGRSDQGCITSSEGVDGWGRDCYYGAQNLNHYHVWLARCEIVESLPACGLPLLLLVGRSSSHLVGLGIPSSSPSSFAGCLSTFKTSGWEREG